MCQNAFSRIVRKITLSLINKRVRNELKNQTLLMFYVMIRKTFDLEFIFKIVVGAILYPELFGNF